MSRFYDLIAPTKEKPLAGVDYIVTTFSSDTGKFQTFMDSVIRELSARGRTAARELELRSFTTTERPEASLAEILVQLQMAGCVLNNNRVIGYHGNQHLLNELLDRSKDLVQRALNAEKERHQAPSLTSDRSTYQSLEDLMEGHAQLAIQVSGMNYAEAMLSILYAKQRVGDKSVASVAEFNKDYATRLRLKLWTSRFRRILDDFDPYFGVAEIEATPTNLTLTIPAEEEINSANHKERDGRMFVHFEKEGSENPVLKYHSTVVESEYDVAKPLGRTNVNMLRDRGVSVTSKAILPTFKEVVKKIDQLGKNDHKQKHLVGDVLTRELPLSWVNSQNLGIETYELEDEYGLIRVEVSVVGAVRQDHHRVKIIAQYIMYG